VLACVLGIAVGSAMAAWRWAHDLLEPWITIFYATPLIALAPLVILWFGVGVLSRWPWSSSWASSRW
jgi:NitT/TauT family transport system permease protein